jgi:hypothetical protein
VDAGALSVLLILTGCQLLQLYRVTPAAFITVRVARLACLSYGFRYTRSSCQRIDSSWCQFSCTLTALCSTLASSSPGSSFLPLNTVAPTVNSAGSVRYVFCPTRPIGLTGVERLSLRSALRFHACHLASASLPFLGILQKPPRWPSSALRELGALCLRGKACILRLCDDSDDGPGFDLWHVLFECTATSIHAMIVTVSLFCRMV